MADVYTQWVVQKVATIVDNVECDEYKRELLTDDAMLVAAALMSTFCPRAEQGRYAGKLQVRRVTRRLLYDSRWLSFPDDIELMRYALVEWADSVIIHLLRDCADRVGTGQ